MGATPICSGASLAFNALGAFRSLIASLIPGGEISGRLASPRPLKGRAHEAS